MNQGDHHLLTAIRNNELLCQLVASFSTDYFRWKITVAFYTALHLMHYNLYVQNLRLYNDFHCEYLLVNGKRTKNSKSHGKFHCLLEANRDRIKVSDNCLKLYRRLMELSMFARYEVYTPELLPDTYALNSAENFEESYKKLRSLQQSLTDYSRIELPFRTKIDKETFEQVRAELLQKTINRRFN